MSNEVLAIIIAIIIMVPAILFYEFIVIRNYADKFLPCLLYTSDAADE